MGYPIGIPLAAFLLPRTGVIVESGYQQVGKLATGGNKLIIGQIHEPAGGVPSRMVPLILVSTSAEG